MAGKGGGAWKVAYADFVTAMMAFFLVMWITAQSKETKQAIAQYFNDPYGTSSKPGKGSAVVPIFKGSGTGNGSPKLTPGQKGGTIGPVAKALPREGAKDERAKKRSAVVEHDGSHNSIGIVVPFADDSAELDEKALERLADLVPSMLGKPNKIEIRGHSSARPLPPDSRFKSSWELSYARCLSTLEYLKQEGIEPERLRLSQAGAFEPPRIRPEPDLQTTSSRVEVYMLDEYVDKTPVSPEPKAPRFNFKNRPAVKAAAESS
jgi:chemotaxis protein MotB